MQTSTGPAAAGSRAARFGAAALAALAVLPVTGAGTASAVATTAPPAALYGKGDPTADGVWRQSLALTALSAGQVVPADSAVSWLTGQQCADGGWTAYRADPAVPCEATSEDSNATAVAIQALAQLGGHQAAVTKGSGWLKDTQNADGSWPLHPGRPGDAASTGLAVNALIAAGIDPTSVSGKAGKNGYDGLALFQLGCAAPAEQRGAFTKAGASADVPTTALATLAAAGGRLPVTNTNRVDAAPRPLSCPGSTTAVPRTDAGEAASAYLDDRLTANGQHLTLPSAGATPAPDYAATAWAVLGLIQAGHPHQAASAADWLGGNAYAWAAKGPSGTDAAATALLLLTAQAAQLDPYNFGGTNILQLLVDAGPAPKSVPSSASSALAENPDGTKAPGSGITEADDNGGFSPIWLIGIGLLVGIGGGLLLSLNRRRTAAS